MGEVTSTLYTVYALITMKNTGYSAYTVHSVKTRHCYDNYTLLQLLNVAMTTRLCNKR